MKGLRKKIYFILFIFHFVMLPIIAIILYSANFNTNEVVVAVIDTGIDYKHKDLKKRIIKGIDLVEFDRKPMDENGHGTHIAGIISSKTKDVKILAVRTLNKKGEGTGYASLGILYAIFKGADIVNMSFSETYNPFSEWFIRYGKSKGILFVAPTGNEGKKSIDYPAKYKGVLAVGGINEKTGELYKEGNKDKNIDFVAPSVDVASTDMHNSYEIKTGTSMSSAYVTGVLAYMKEKNKNLTDKELEKQLKKETKENKYGYKEVNYRKTVALNEPNELYLRVEEPKDIFIKKNLLRLKVESINIEKIYVYVNGKLKKTYNNPVKEMKIPIEENGEFFIEIYGTSDKKYIKEQVFAVNDTIE